MAELFRRIFYKVNQSKDPAALGIVRFAFGMFKSSIKITRP